MREQEKGRNKVIVNQKLEKRHEDQIAELECKRDALNKRWRCQKSSIEYRIFYKE